MFVVEVLRSRFSRPPLTQHWNTGNWRRGGAWQLRYFRVGLLRSLLPLNSNPAFSTGRNSLLPSTYPNLMETLPVELLRLIFAYCDPPSVRSLREANRTLADVGYEYLLAPHLNIVTWRQDVDRLLSIALHERLKGSISSICIYLGELSYGEAVRNSW